jgi:hypothetical protein
VYLDHAATTPISAPALAALTSTLIGTLLHLGFTAQVIA